MKKAKLILAIIIGFYISIFLKNNIFLGNTPRLKPFLARRLFEYLNNFGKGEKKDTFNNKKENFYPISKGIYAKEVKGGRIIVIREKEVNWKIYQYVLNGKKISIKIPEGEERPPQEVVERIFSR